jgi:general transcription factor 3C polypeptide 3 (transcription factor C subunit 4)
MLCAHHAAAVTTHRSTCACLRACPQEYERRRGNLQESSYNLARALHQLGLTHLAVPLYERALAAQPCAGQPAIEGLVSEDLDMRQAAAHNLALIYRQSGADDLARQVMAKHLVV